MPSSLEPSKPQKQDWDADVAIRRFCVSSKVGADAARATVETCEEPLSISRESQGSQPSLKMARTLQRQGSRNPPLSSQRLSGKE
jgi:hypothetical protein